MPVKKLEAVIRFEELKAYNCGAGIMSGMRVVNQRDPYQYVDPDYLIENKDAIVKDFLKYIDDPFEVNKQKVEGCAAHYVGHSTYWKLAFWMFHDNVKSDLASKDNPFTDGSAFFNYLWHNQEKYGVTITRTHMADNVYHDNNCSHPGRCYILTPPSIQVLAPGVKLADPVLYKKGIKSVLLHDARNMYPDDVKVLQDLVA